MTIKEILDKTDHRPWSLPTKRWQFYQEWNQTIFLHYEVELEVLKAFVPKELKIDLYDGKAWISFVAFNMENVRPNYLPAFSPISNFHEINIRTYVTSNNKTGVYFLSIEAGNKISSYLAKTLSGLPYRYSNMERNENQFVSKNNTFKDHFNCSYTIGESVNSKTELDLWLTERYALFQDVAHSINEFEIHHIPWSIHELSIDHIEINYPRFNHLIVGIPHKIHYSPGVQVLAWGKNIINFT
jgi:hypothetical protein